MTQKTKLFKIIFSDKVVLKIKVFINLMYENLKGDIILNLFSKSLYQVSKITEYLFLKRLLIIILMFKLIILQKMKDYFKSMLMKFLSNATYKIFKTTYIYSQD